MRIEVPHMFDELDECFKNIDKIVKSVEKSEHYTDNHQLERITLPEAVYTGDPSDTLVTNEGIIIGWYASYGKFIFAPQPINNHIGGEK